MKPIVKVPRIIHALFRWYCRHERYEELHGDIEEIFQDRVESKGLFRANFHYLLDVIRCCQPYAWKKIEKTQNSIFKAMLLNDIKTSGRNLKRNKLYTLINVLGLAIGIICCMVIFLIIKSESSFDNFHDKGDRIYRIVNHKETSMGTSTMAASFYPMAKTLLNDVPQLENAVVTHYSESGLISVIDSVSGNISRYQEDLGVGFSGPSFFEIFDFELILGEKSSVLSKPGSVAISESAAKIYFGDSNPIGQTITLENTLVLEVTGVYKDFPANTDIPFSRMIIELGSLPEVNRMADLEDWRTQLSSIQTFVVLPQNYTSDLFDLNLKEFASKNFDREKYLSFEFYAQPLANIHSDDRYQNYYQQPISKTAMTSLMIIGLFIIITACINFINLATAQSLQRAKAAGIKKVLGSDKWRLMLHFFVETSIIVALAIGISLALSDFVLITLQNYIEFSAPITMTLTVELIVFVGVIFVCTVIISGLYPALLISRFDPIQVIKGQFSGIRGSGLNIRKSLIVFQFIISQALIIGVIVVSKQISFFTNYNFGFESDQIIQFPLPETDIDKLELLKTELSQSPMVVSSSFSMATPMTEGDLSSEVSYPDGGIPATEVVLKFGDVDYLKTYGIALLVGRKLRSTDSLNNLLVNEAFVKKMNMGSPDSAIGKMVKFGSKQRMIVGVIQDFNSENFHHQINPLLIGILPSYYYTGGVKISGGNTQEALSHIHNSWEKVFPEYVFDFSFYTESIARLYKEEKRVSSLFTIFSSISIFISGIGLFGLVTFMAAQRTKEIGIRKVLGASMAHIVGIFSSEFAKLIAIALLIASPIAWYVMDRWLLNFEYRIDIGPPVFIAAGLITLIITIMTVSFKSVLAAKANPVVALKNDA